MKPAAILWDYDGTLVDSAVKNRAVTIDLLRRFDRNIEQHLPAALVSVAAYRRANLRWESWQAVFQNEYHLSDAEVAKAAELWADCQRADPLQPPLFNGLREVLPVLAAAAPMAVCSRNSSDNIRATLRRYGVLDCFGAVVGSTELPAADRKPAPGACLAALAALGLRGDEGPILCIGDHREDVLFAHAAQQTLRSRGLDARVLCVTARFGDKVCLTAQTGADGCAAAPEQLPGLLQQLG